MSPQQVVEHLLTRDEIADVVKIVIEDRLDTVRWVIGIAVPVLVIAIGWVAKLVTVAGNALVVDKLKELGGVAKVHDQRLNGHGQGIAAAASTAASALSLANDTAKVVNDVDKRLIKTTADLENTKEKVESVHQWKNEIAMDLGALLKERE